MKNYKRAQVVMLPTQNINRLLYLSTDVSPSLLSNWRGEAQELYITSDDEIKKGDWFINLQHNKIYQCEPKPFFGEIWVNQNKDICKKIIATTDTSLTVMLPHDVLIGSRLPQPSQQFIEKYIESYNKGKVITDVLVEYELYCNTGKYPNIKKECNCPCTEKINCGNTLKVNPKDNTIVIKELKESWNREEMKAKLFELLQDIQKDETLLEHYAGDYREFDKWIKENLQL
jgi:hypothetical protein